MGPNSCEPFVKRVGIYALSRANFVDADGKFFRRRAVDIRNSNNSIVRQRDGGGSTLCLCPALPDRNHDTSLDIPIIEEISKGVGREAAAQQ